MTDDEKTEQRRICVFNDADALARHAAHEIARIANECITVRGRFDLVLAGGATPKATYEHLHNENCVFEKWHVWFGDERCLPARHADRNDTMAHAALLDRAGIPAAQVHCMPAESGPDQAARVYASKLSNLKEFDLVLLGLGEDGHTASLFPGHNWGEGAGSPSVMPVHDAPKPPPDRVTLSAARLGRSRHVFFLIAGHGKRDAVARLRRGAAIPANAIRPASGVDIFLTRDAAA